MKLHLNPEDLESLSLQQKESLRYLWMPEKNEMVCAFICTNAETEEYSSIVFVTGEVLLDELRNRLILRSYKLKEEEAGEDLPENLADETEDESFDDETEPFYIEPEQFFNKEDCLPLLNVGQLIDLLKKTRLKNTGVNLHIPGGEQGKLFEKGYTLELPDGEAFEDDELCDLLWNVLKEAL